MNQPILALPPFQRFCGRAVILAGLVSAGMLPVGCSSMSGPDRTARLAGTAPVPMLVRPGEEMAAAEQAAARDEFSFVLLGAGKSMEPLYASGTAIVVKEQHFRTLRAGMVVVFRNHQDRYVAHLLVEEMAQAWITAGLNNGAEDDEWMTAENFVGVVQAAYASTDTRFRAEISAGLARQRGGEHSARVAARRD